MMGEPRRVRCNATTQRGRQCLRDTHLTLDGLWYCWQHCDRGNRAKPAPNTVVFDPGLEATRPEILVRPGVTAGDVAAVAHFWYVDAGVQMRLCDGDTDVVGRSPDAARRSQANCQRCIDLYAEDVVRGSGRLRILWADRDPVFDLAFSIWRDDLAVDARHQWWAQCNTCHVTRPFPGDPARGELMAIEHTDTCKAPAALEAALTQATALALRV